MSKHYFASLLCMAIALTTHPSGAVAQDAELPAAVKALVGCYALELGRGLPADAEIPATIAVLETPPKLGRRMLIPSARFEGIERPGFWRVLPNGGVRFGWTDGFINGLLRIDLAPTPAGGFAGRAITMVDIVGSETTSVAAKASRVPCPAHLLSAGETARSGGPR